MNEQKNLIATVILSALVLFGFHYFYEKPKIDRMTQTPSPQPSLVIAPPVQATLSREEALKASLRLAIKAPAISGSINLKGGLLDDVTLEGYQETTKAQSPKINILSPEQSFHAYQVLFTWQGRGDVNISLPTTNTMWKPLTPDTLTPQTPVTLVWDNGKGLIFERTFTIDENYFITVCHKVTNNTDHNVQISPGSSIHRAGVPELSDFFILHEGPIGVLNDHLEEISYSKLKEKNHIAISSSNGWVGITDKYWLTALIPTSGQPFTGHFKAQTSHQTDHFMAEVQYDFMDIKPKQTFKLTEHVFIGAKRVHLLDQYKKQYNIPRFDLAIDFGWFYFLTKPIFSFLSLLNEWLGNFGLSILLMTVLIKLILFPLANKSYRSMAKMKKLHPELTKLKEKFGDDRVKMNEAMMEMYKKYQINPLAGCLPMVMQIPVFFALYKVLFVTIEMRHSSFFGWIHDLSAPDPTTIFNLFGLIPWTPPSYLMIGLWPIIMGLTMFAQQRLNPQPTDAIQAKVFMLMPVFFTIILAQFSAGLVIYWAWNNLLSIGQQWLIMRLESRNIDTLQPRAEKPKWKK